MLIETLIPDRYLVFEPNKFKKNCIHAIKKERNNLGIFFSIHNSFSSAKHLFQQP